MTETILDLWLSGETRRWYCNPAVSRLGQNNADHQGRCAQLVCALWPDASRALIWAALHHDVGEYHAGDLSWLFKESADPAVIEAHAAIEAQALAKICGRPMPPLSAADGLRLKLVDRLEALIFVRIHLPQEYARLGSGWRVAEVRILAQAIYLGVEDPVRGMLDRITRGDW